ncbi:MAG: hypothetical protein ACFUZC_15645 [Chthoniobacteraceae bacterium]
MFKATLHREGAQEVALALRGRIDRLNEALEVCAQDGVNPRTLHGVLDAARGLEEGLKRVEVKPA